jgi:hypothetical protein
VGLTVGVKLSEQSPLPTELAKEVTSSEIPPTRETQPQSEVVSPQPSTNEPINQAVVPPSLTDREKLLPPTPVTPPETPQLSQPSPTTTQNSKVKPSQTELVIIPQVTSQPQTSKTTQPEITVTPQPVESEKPLSTKVPTFQDNANNLPPIDRNSDNILSLQPENPPNQIREEENYQDELPRLSSDNPNDTVSLFDYIPQVAEVRDYFQDRWQAPEDLKQTLQYRLVINQNGHLQTVIPLGYNAEIYLKQVKFPSNNQAFVSPLLESNRQVIRLVLQPNGQVITFLDN